MRSGISSRRFFDTNLSCWQVNQYEVGKGSAYINTGYLRHRLKILIAERRGLIQTIADQLCENINIFRIALYVKIDVEFTEKLMVATGV